MNHESASKNDKLNKIGLYSAILSAICWVIYILGGTGNPGLRTIEEPQLFFQAIQDSRATILLYGWGGVLGTLFAVPYILAIYSSIKKKTSVGIVVMGISLIGIVLALIGFMKPLTLVYLIAPLGMNAGVGILKTMQIAVLIMGEAVEVSWFIGSFLVFGLGIGMLALYALKYSIGSKLINYIGIIGGLSGVVWLAIFFPFLENAGVLLRITNITSILVWSIGLMISLVRSKV
jgi:hypothetical protein